MQSPAIGSVLEGSDVAILSVVRRTNTAHAVLFMALVVPAACGSPPPADPPPPPEVAVVALATEQVTMTAELPGRTVAVMVSEVRPQIRGIIQRRLFTEGQQVKSGQVLYQIDPALYQADYDSAAATLARAEAARVSVRLLAERYAELVKIEAVSKQQNDDASAAYARAEADVATARGARHRAHHPGVHAHHGADSWSGLGFGLHTRRSGDREPGEPVDDGTSARSDLRRHYTVE